MKKIKIFAFLFLGLFIIGISNSFAVTATFTADNEILAWWGYDGFVWVPLESLDPNKTDKWWETETKTVGNYQQFIWQAVNWTSEATVNPGGFLGEIDGLLSSKAWKVALNNSLVVPTNLDNFFNTTLTWGGATEYGANDSDNSVIWYKFNGGPLTSINGAAQWIWWNLNFDNPGAPFGSDSVFIKVQMTNPVPEPATMILLGSGLLGLAGLRRKFKK